MKAVLVIFCAGVAGIRGMEKANSMPTLELMRQVCETPLIRAIREKNVKLMYDLLESQADVNCADSKGNTPLHYAAKTGSQEVALALLAARANMGLQNKAGRTAAHEAAKKGNSSLVALLLDGGFDIEARDGNESTHKVYLPRNTKEELIDWYSKGRTLLHYAALYGHEQLVKNLLDRGASVEAEDRTGNRSLHLAAACGHYKAVLLLLQRGAHVNASNAGDHYSAFPFDQLLYSERTGYNGNCEVMPLHYASAYGHLEIVELLLEHDAEVNAGKDAQKNHAHTPLHYAAQNGHCAVVAVLLDHGASLGTLYWDGMSALYLAVEDGHSDVAKLLIKRGAQTSSMKEDIGDHEFILMHVAAANGHTHMVDTLLSINASINALSSKLETPLHLAARRGHPDLVSYLIEKGALLEARDCALGTPFSYACYPGKNQRAHKADYFRAALIMLESGAYVHARDCLTIAVGGHRRPDWCNVELIKLLLQHGALAQDPRLAQYFSENELLQSVLRQDMATIEKILNNYSSRDVESNAEDIRTVFTIAASQGTMPLLELIHKNYGETLTGKTINRALVSASFAGNLDAIGYILLHYSIDDATAQRAFITATFSGNVKTLSFLRDQLFIKDLTIGKALWQACMYLHARVVKHLLDIDFHEGLGINLNAALKHINERWIGDETQDEDKIKRDAIKRLLAIYRDGKLAQPLLMWGRSTEIDSLGLHISDLPAEMIVHIIGYCLTL